MDSTSLTSNERMTSCFVVRHTFIDVVDLPTEAPRRSRANSDSDLYARGCTVEKLQSLGSPFWTQPDKRCGGADWGVDFGSLSDAETMSYVTEDGPLPHRASSKEVSDTQSEVGTEGGPASISLSQWSCGTQSEASDGSHAEQQAARVASLEAVHGQPASPVDVKQLLLENRRLQMENRLLREGATASAPSGAGAGRLPPSLQLPAEQRRAKGAEEDRLLQEGRHVSASSGAYVSHPSSDQLPPEQRKAKADDQTTVMLRNLPNNYTRAMLLSMLDKEGFAGLYNFLYLPIDFKSGACLGYAFVNLADAAVAAKFWRAFDGYHSWVLPSKKVCHLSWSGPHQGLQAHIDRYRNSPIMHESVPDECKPVVFKDGLRTAFPGPTKSTKAPRVRTQRPHCVKGKAQASQRRFNVH